jgi:uncharacterized protein
LVISNSKLNFGTKYFCERLLFITNNFTILDQNQKQLIKLAHTKMPFGKYEGWFLIDIPEYYIVWYSNKGFPKGELGEQLKLIHELKLNGLEELIRNIKKNYPKP